MSPPRDAILASFLAAGASVACLMLHWWRPFRLDAPQKNPKNTTRKKSRNVDPEKLNQWMGKLLAEKGVDIFRTKGFISYEGESRRIVFQGVHMLFTAQADREWGDEPRHNQLVFIGRNLDEVAMREGFDQCLI